ncbi:hypothetical protein A7K94_0213060, partial [Modestobacter sp. VKM Ac-2676]
MSRFLSRSGPEGPEREPARGRAGVAEPGWSPDEPVTASQPPADGPGTDSQPRVGRPPAPPAPAAGRRS